MAILQENHKGSSLQTKTANEARKGELKNIVRVGLLCIFFLITFVNFRYKLCFCNTVNIYSHANKPCWWWLWLNTLPRCKEHRDICWGMLSYSKQQAERRIWSSFKDRKNRRGSDCRDVTTVPEKMFAANGTERDPVVVYTFSESVPLGRVYSKVSKLFPSQLNRNN